MTTKLPLISIITISFNSEKSIEQTIKSVLNQSYTNIEYIIVDGLSKDKTMGIVASYIEIFKEKNIILRFISEKDDGISDAFNKGVNMANGELVGIINSDDWLEHDAVETIVQNLENNIGIYCGWLNLYNPDLKYIKTRKSRPYLLPFGMYINHPTVFVRRKIYTNIIFDTKLKVAMDYDFLLKSLKQGVKIKSIDKVIANMRLGGISCDMETMRFEEKIVMKINLNFFVYFLARMKVYWEEKLFY
jgi:glycosyltransferase involved in cell wall biosynthesis